METFSDFSYLDEPPTIRLEARIAALEAIVARLTAPVTEEEADQAISDYYSMVNNMRPGSDMQIAITAFLERRINGC